MQLASYRSFSLFLFLSSLVVFGLVGCGQGAPTPIKLKGELVFNADQVSKGATARISLFEHGANGGEKRIVAEHTLHRLTVKPIQFEFEVAQDLVDNNGQYALRAQILSADGDVEWTTRETASIKPSTQDQPVALALTRLADSASPTFRRYNCPDGFFLDVAETADGAVLKMGNRRLQLSMVKTRSRLKIYEDDHGNRFALGADGNSNFVIDGSTHKSCIAGEDSDEGGSDAQA